MKPKAQKASKVLIYHDSQRKPERDPERIQRDGERATEILSGLVRWSTLSWSELNIEQLTIYLAYQWEHILPKNVRIV